MNKRLKLGYWIKFLESHGFERRANYGSDYNMWFFKDDFYVGIIKQIPHAIYSVTLPHADLNGTQECPEYSVIKKFEQTVHEFRFRHKGKEADIRYLLEDANDIETVIEAMADPVLFPLCVNIKWIQDILTEVFKNEGSICIRK